LESREWEKYKFLSGFQLQKGRDLCSRCQMLVISIKKQNRLVDQLEELVPEKKLSFLLFTLIIFQGSLTVVLVLYNLQIILAF
jgi:hypothetical protein